MRDINEAYKYAERKGIIDRHGAPTVSGTSTVIVAEPKSVGAVMAEITDSHTPEANKTILADALNCSAREPLDDILRRRRRVSLIKAP